MKSSQNSSDLEPLYVASPLLPDLDKFHELLSDIWDSKYVTNHGPYHDKLEQKLEQKLKVPNVKLFNNGTIALVTALKKFNFQQDDEIITTPFTFAATPHAISWNGLKPVFVDIKKDDFTIDPECIKLAITPKTKAILAVHVYGNICDLEAIQKIADKHNLKIIYDAAHAFDVQVNGKGIAEFGDATIFSFHATKLFTTIEGGAIATPSIDDAEKLYMLRNFGIKNEEEVVDIGINGKLNEIQAAIGLLNLDTFENEIKKRSDLRNIYNTIFNSIIGVHTQALHQHITCSQQYYPLQITEYAPITRDQLYDALKAVNIFPRKYFYPSCLDFDPYKDFTLTHAKENVVKKIKSQVICLPFHSGVTEEYVAKIKSVVDVLLSRTSY